MISIAVDGGKSKGESVVIRLRTEEIFPLRKVVYRGQDILGGGGTERNNTIEGGKRET